MKIEIDTKNITFNELELLIDLLSKIKEKSLSDEEISVDNIASAELTDEMTLAIVHKMHKYALSMKFGQSFKATELYRKAIEGNWIDLSPNTRKAIGRQFKKVADEHWESQKDGDTVIEFKERNIQNTAIYQVVQKESL